MRWLETHSAQWAEQSGPAAYAQLVFLAADAATFDPRDFGGQDLVKQLNATGPAPASLPAEPTASASAAEAAKKKDDSGVSVWWIIGVGLVGGIGIGFLISARNKKQQP